MPPIQPPSKPDEASAPSRAAQGHASFQLWLLNVFVGTLVGSLWLFDSPGGLSVGLRLYVSLALVSSVAMLALMPGALFLVAARVLPSWRLVGLVQAFSGSLFLSLLYTDTIVYRLLRYHFNGAVLNVALTPGAGDAVHLGPRVWITATVVISVLCIGQYAFWRWRVRRMQARVDEGRPPAFVLQPRVVILAFLLPVIGIEKSVYAAADISGDHELLHASRPLPLFPRPRLSRLIDPDAALTLEVLPREASLAYPLAPPELEPDGPRPSFFVLVVDSWRRDAFTPELTPAISRFAENARVFADHVSTGNGTRYGLFGMLYGLHGSYWFPFLRERRSPVLLDVLQQEGYDVRVFSSASMNFPEFLDTAWSGLPRENVLDDFDDAHRATPAWIKDERVATAVDDWLARRERESDARPFFCFVLLDAPHQPYTNPGGPYQPSVQELDYIELGRTTEGPELETLVTRVRNAYKNSVLHADGVAGRLFGSLAHRGALDETVVVVTGDHGEEFYECGYWGHTSNFAPEQVEVPFLMSGPTIEPGLETRPTSHLDLAGSLLELLGADRGQRRDYTLGDSLFDPPVHRARAVAGWSEIGLWTDSAIFSVPLEIDRDYVLAYDRQWRLLADVEERARGEHVALEELARDCVRFLRPRE